MAASIVFLLALSGALFQLVSSVAPHHQYCLCLPHQSCFPKAIDWKALNHSVGGRLIEVSPAAAPCHNPTFNAASCNATKANWINALWRSDQAGASQHPQWDGYHQDSCLVGGDANTTCSQGSVPLYAVEVSKASDVAMAFIFAHNHNIRLIVKNTGHDYFGRSSGLGSLSIWTHNLKSIDFQDNFLPDGGCSSLTTSAVTVGAGVQWGELHQLARDNHKVIVGAFSKSVGAAGGYVMGGGHSTISPRYGFAADNVLQFELVTPDGMYRVANQCQNKELFWALRGGGGGTFGVVLSVTHKTHDAPHHVLQTVLSVAASDMSSLTDFFEEYASLQPSLGDAGWGGTFTAVPNGAHINYVLVDGDETAAAKDWEPLVSLGNSHPGIEVNQSVFMVPTYFDYFNGTLCRIFGPGCSDLTGSNEILASRLIPRSTLVNSPDKVAQGIVSVLTRQSNGTRKSVLGMSVGGGEGAFARDNALNPAWRNATWHMIVQAVWEEGASEEEKQIMFADVSDAIAPLRELTPESGSYFNEGDYNEPDWQRSLFGDHYDRLLKLKHAVDPQHRLTCHHCVGSEVWNNDNTCRSA